MQSSEQYEERGSFLAKREEKRKSMSIISILNTNKKYQHYIKVLTFMGFPAGSVGKNPPA